MDYVERFTIELSDPNFNEKIVSVFREYGVCMVTGVVPPDECTRIVGEIIDDLDILAPAADSFSIETWSNFNLPPQTRPGLYQSVLSHLPVIWKQRTNPNIKKIFSTLYSALREEPVESLVPSIDGINLHPNELVRNRPDWPHVDQTKYDDIFKCIQGQLVLTRTTASFVCSPKSHLIFKDGLELMNMVGDSGNWCRYEDVNIQAQLRMLVESKGGKWQIPIVRDGYSIPGSFIVWSSALIHSARNNKIVEETPPEDFFLGWRCVLYICLRPRSEFTEAQLKKIRKYIIENRTMNHWNLHVFPKSPGGRFQPPRSETINALIRNPERVFKRLNIDPRTLVNSFDEFISLD